MFAALVVSSLSFRPLALVRPALHPAPGVFALSTARLTELICAADTEPLEEESALSEAGDWCKPARRAFVGSAVSAFLGSSMLPASAAPSAEEQDALDLWSRTAPGRLLPSGVRVIDVVEGTGPQPQKGQKVYCHFKVWTGGFRSGEPADSSFLQARVYEWFLGRPTDRMVPGADEGALGMREGGWRRLVIPAELAYGETGLRKPGTNGKESNVFAVPPNTPVYWDLRMVDGGSGKCAEILHPPGVSDKVSLRLKSISCVRGLP